MKRRNYSPHTVKNYLNTLKHFVLWVNVPVEEVVNKHILYYIDFLMRKRLKPKTINCHLVSIRVFYEYLHNEEEIRIPNPVKRGYVLKQSKPLPKHLRDEEVEKLFAVIKNLRDRAMFKVMLRCGLRVEEIANTSLKALHLKRRLILVKDGKGSKDRVVYISNDAYEALAQYLRSRPSSRTKKIFLVEKGTFKGKPISVRGIQKRMEYYARKAGVKSSCHQLRHTMATQLLNADMDLVSIQDLLGHSRIATTERYIKVSNLKVMRDYFKAIDVVTKSSVHEVSSSNSREMP
ncbi:MAG: tyrosine-type recombinase/integrase [Deltaproteobacteria bacterium]|nr:tyrosine-type recombinase/integrase [Deltaproteobacteria bacterium]